MWLAQGHKATEQQTGILSSPTLNAALIWLKISVQHFSFLVKGGKHDGLFFYKSHFEFKSL